MALFDAFKRRDDLIEEAVEASYANLSDPSEDPRDDRFHLTIYYDQLPRSQIIRERDQVLRGEI